LITGSCGTVGSELTKQLLKSDDYQPSEVLCIDNNESELFFQEQSYLSDSRARFVLADLRDRDSLVELLQGVDVVFHTAAYKHVVMCERSPMQAVQTNILGVQNIIYASQTNDVEKVIFTSSDKAVNPTNVMGTTKLMGERLITAANNSQREHKTIFASTRFGNVLGSNGSVIPIFKKQIEKGGPVTLTSPEMTRFVMTIEQSAKLVLNSAEIACGGEVFITKMPIINIKDLAEVMIRKLSIEYGHSSDSVSIDTIGAKPGEKLYEELMSDEETRRSVELSDYFAVLPAFKGIYKDIDYKYSDFKSSTVSNPYNSSIETQMTQEELTSFLETNNLLRVIEDGPSQRYWPGDKESATANRGIK